MPIFSRLATTFLCIATPCVAAAQEAKIPVTDCASLIARFAPLVEVKPDSTVESIDNGCRAANIFISQSAYARWKVAALNVTGKNLFASITAERLPETLDVALTGLHLSIDAGTPLSNYVMEVTQLPFNIHLAYRWDTKSKDLTLDDLSISGPRFGSIAVSGTTSGVSKMPSLAFQPDEEAKLTAIRRLSFKLDNHGVFESMVVVPIVSALPQNQDPKPLIENYRRIAITFVDALPQTVATSDSKNAMKAFITEFPHPTGRYQLNVDTKHPVPVADIAEAGINPLALNELLTTFTLSALKEPEAAK